MTTTPLALSDYDFDLPDDQIARYPAPERSASRLLVLDRDQHTMEHSTFNHLRQWLRPGDCLVVNDTRVMRARLYGRKSSGGQVECLIAEAVAQDWLQNHARCLLKCNRLSELPATLHFDQGVTATVTGKSDQYFDVHFNCSLVDAMTQAGETPIPPYFERHAEAIDDERYQTVFAERRGAIAAPTAGLHFDEGLLTELKDFGIITTKLTLHVGYGTFQPIQNDDIENHTMHEEWYEIDADCCQTLKQTHERGGRIIAVGTTTVRALESAWQRHGQLCPHMGTTDLFIKPGFHFQGVDGLITNFHIPKSTLLLLVSAFINTNITHTIYPEAIRQGYRFYSYGDAMFIHRPPS